ncbi:MAG TPA: indole-3-glycerol phosphate synthase TrpC [Hyphomicrobiaceae bacterium]
MILDEILARKREEVADRRASHPELSLPAESPRGFAAALRQLGVSVIAEFKRRSPSGGDIRPDATPSDIAQVYAANGARAMSVLTDAHYFSGADSDLVEARDACGLPVLRKDFVVDAYQLHEARAIGADAVLLIVRALSDSELREFVRLSASLGLDALVETHSADEVRRALDAGATIVGVNNRDLDTLVTDVTLAPRLRLLVPPECLFVAESGVSTPEQIATLADAGVDAVLVGEALLRAADPGARLRLLVEAGEGARV